MNYEEASEVLYEHYSVYNAEVKNALYILADKDTTKQHELVIELATKLVKDRTQTP